MKAITPAFSPLQTGRVPCSRFVTAMPVAANTLYP